MSNDTEIRPALTAGEWHDASGAEGPTALKRDNLWAQLTPGRLLVARTPGDRSCLIGDEDAHAMVALANAALPDDDPRKITRADAVLAEWCGTYGENPDWMTHETAERLHALARKLASLLPPNAH